MRTSAGPASAPHPADPDPADPDPAVLDPAVPDPAVLELPAPHAAGRRDAVLDDVTTRLRARGERMTGPRGVVVSALAAQTRHITAEELIEAVAAIDPQVHRASVYRSLETLTALGMVQHVHVSHGPTAYHLIGTIGVHPHAQCRTCGTLTDLPVGLLDDVAARLRAETGFTLDATHMALSGQCATCAQSEEEGPTAPHSGVPRP